MAFFKDDQQNWFYGLFVSEKKGRLTGRLTPISHKTIEKIRSWLPRIKIFSALLLVFFFGAYMDAPGLQDIHFVLANG